MILMTAGWLSSLRAWASAKISSARRSRSSACSDLTATSRRNTRSSHRNTVPNPPAPRIAFGTYCFIGNGPNRRAHVLLLEQHEGLIEHPPQRAEAVQVLLAQPAEFRPHVEDRRVNLGQFAEDVVGLVAEPGEGGVESVEAVGLIGGELPEP